MINGSNFSTIPISNTKTKNRNIHPNTKLMAAPKGNIFAIGNLGGAPPYYKTEEELKNKIEEYFEFCITDKINLTITGLALYLGFCDRQSLYDYEKKEEFSCTIKRARTTVENSYEQKLYTMTFGGAIFALKNMGWFDKIEQEVNQTVTNVTVEVIKKDAPDLSNSEGEVK